MASIPNLNNTTALAPEPIQTPADEWAKETSSAIHTSATTAATNTVVPPPVFRTESSYSPDMPGGFGKDSARSLAPNQDDMAVAMESVKQTAAAAAGTAVYLKDQAVQMLRTWSFFRLHFVLTSMQPIWATSRCLLLQVVRVHVVVCSSF